MAHLSLILLTWTVFPNLIGARNCTSEENSKDCTSQLEDGSVVEFNLTGEDWRMFQIDTPRTSMVDAVILHDRGGLLEQPAQDSDLSHCQDMSIYVSLSAEPVDPEAKLNASGSDVISQLKQTIVLMAQASALCDFRQAIGLSVKNTDDEDPEMPLPTGVAARQYLVVRTTARSNTNTTKVRCPITIHARVRSRAAVVRWGTVMVVSYVVLIIILNVCVVYIIRSGRFTFMLWRLGLHHCWVGLPWLLTVFTLRVGICVQLYSNYWQDRRRRGDPDMEQELLTSQSSVLLGVRNLPSMLDTPQPSPLSTSPFVNLAGGPAVAPPPTTTHVTTDSSLTQPQPSVTSPDEVVEGAPSTSPPLSSPRLNDRRMSVTSESNDAQAAAVATSPNSEPAAMHRCDLCDDDSTTGTPDEEGGQAVCRCVDCNQYLCALHRRAHAKTKAFKTHVMETLMRPNLAVFRQAAAGSATDAAAGTAAASVVDNDEPACRICRDDGAEEPLIKPCKCHGSVAYVHRSCLDTWRQRSDNPENMSRCEICHEPFTLVNASEVMLWYAVGIRAGSFLLRVLLFVVYTEMLILLMSFFTLHTLAPLTCASPTDACSWTVTSLQGHIVGVLYYLNAVTHVYLAAFLRWLWFINSRPAPPVERTVHFKSIRTCIWVTGLTFAFVLLELFTGYFIKFVLYMTSVYMVWEWDISLALGTFGLIGLFLLSVLVITIADAVLGYRNRVMQELVTVEDRSPVTA